jgi:hypothetical protein
MRLALLARLAGSPGLAFRRGGGCAGDRLPYELLLVGGRHVVDLGVFFFHQFLPLPH